MIRKHLYRAVFVVMLAIISSVYLSGLFNQQKHQLEVQQQLAQLSVIQSQIGLLIEQTDWQQANANQSLLEKLQLIPAISSSQIKTGDNQILLNKDLLQSRGQPNATTSHFYLPPIDATQSSNTLVLNINVQRIPNSPITSQAVVMFLLWGGLITLFFFHQFKWVSQLEQFANHILISEFNHPLKGRNRFHNVIGQALNQLILNNTHLMQAKTELTDKIRKTSYIDEVTELGNQLFFKAELQVRLHNHDEAESGLVMILSFVDTDTKTSKYLTDEQQQEIANLLKSLVEDINQSLVARLKDAEFVLLLPNFTADQTDQFCKKTIALLAKTVFDKIHQGHFVDIGISTYKQGFGYYNILSEADMALRNAQLQGANSWFVYGEPLAQHKAKGSLSWRNFLQKVLDRREIVLYSQSLHYFKGKPISHREILSRISDGDEVISADSFLVMADKCGLAAEFDRQIIDSVIKHLLYQEDNIAEHKYSINIFTSSLFDQRFVHWLLARLSSYPELNQQLIFELPENQISKHIDAIYPVMEQFASLGVSWAVEHFGAPAEDLSYLDKAPISMVKVDRRIINNISIDKAQQLLLTSLVVTLRNRNIKIFVEGVEKQQDAIYLQQTEIDGAQGYYFDKPQRLSLIERRLKAV